MYRRRATPDLFACSRPALLAALPALALLAFLWSRFDFRCDDAFISFRYARNFARGDGLVYNPGLPPALPSDLGAGPGVELWLFRVRTELSAPDPRAQRQSGPAAQVDRDEGR